MLTYADVNASHLGPELHAGPLLDGAGLGELEVDKVATPSGQEDLRGGGGGWEVQSATGLSP